ncbi:MAG: hypothetical protein Q8L34_06710 [Candidatus Woesearchaeota archaeon]|nr:hypothetical protein [Candidatus Woesearchaeota archaeon]
MSILNKITNIYRQNGKTFLYHAASVGISTVACAVTAGCLEEQGCNPALNSSITTGVGAVSYWAPFIGMLARNERNEMKDESGKYSPKKVVSKIAQYASFIGIGEVFFGVVRGVVQYQLQKRFDAASASALTDLACATAYGVLVPPIRYVLRNVGREGKLENIVSLDQQANKTVGQVQE